MRLPRLYRARALLVASVLAAAACKNDPTPVAPAPTASSAAPTTSVDEALAFLQGRGVTRDRLTPAATRLRLYSWTTTEQADELRKTKVLLSRSESPERGASTYDHAMHAAADGGDKVAALLRSAAFQKARFAWTSAWGTRMGYPGETYGDVLVTIDVRAGAYVARYFASSKQWQITTTTGDAVGVQDLLDHPERLGAVYFETETSGDAVHREFVLCNESQIESFSFGMAAELGELGDEIAGLEATAKALREHPTAAGAATEEQLAGAWHEPLGTGPVEPAAKMRRLYLANVALANELYAFAPDKLDAIADSLRAVKASQPVGSYFAGTAAFAGVGGAAPPPVTTPPPRGTYYGTYMPRRKPTGHH